MARGVRLTRSTPWLVLCALAAGGALLAWPLDAALLDWQPARAAAEPWRWWSAALVHWSPRHLAANLAGVAVVAALGIAARCGWPAAIAWALAWPLTQLGLLVQPALGRFGGLSGVLHAAVAVATMQLLLRERGRRRAIGAALLAGLLAKLLLEAPWQAPLHRVPGWDIAIAPMAHATGALAGLLTGAICTLASRRWRPSTMAQ